MRKYFDKTTWSLLLLALLICSGSHRETVAGILQAIIPAAVPTANKLGNSSKFQLGTGSPGSGDCAAFDANGNIQSAGVGTCTGSSGGSVAFSAITGATNSSAAMVVGTGASMDFSGSGSINSSAFQGKTAVQGNGTKVQLSTGSPTSGNCAKFDADGNVVDAGAACGTGSAGFTLVEQHTASSSASLDFTTCISSTYDSYQFELVSVIPATSTANLLMRAGTGAGPSWDTGSNYAWSRLIVITSGSGAGGSTSDTSLEILHSAVTTANETINGTIKLYGPAASSFKNTTGLIQGMETINNQPSIWINDGTYKSTTAVTGWQFFFSSGNIASGTIRCYGIAK